MADMNMDGAVTISDIWLWFKWLYFYPGDLLVKLLVEKLWEIGNFFEMGYSSYGGIFSGVISFLFWGIIYLIISDIFDPQKKQLASKNETT